MIRRATIHDAALLSELGRTSFVEAFADDPRNRPHDMAAYMGQAFAVPRIEAELADDTNLFLIDTLDGEATGYAKLSAGTAEPCVVAKRPIELARLYARAQHLGRGVGAALMQACLDEAIARGHDVLWLGVWEFNPRAVRFYEKWGFRRVGEHTFLLGSDPQIDWIFVRPLTG